MTEATATVKPGRKLTAIWLVPIVAALLGIGLVVYNYLTQGPTITIAFSTAEGIAPGKTKIKALNVELGVVDTVELSKGLKQVVVTAQLEAFARPLLTEDAQFWVVRPRIGPGGISGLSTILSGGHIKLEAGSGEAGRKNFTGLENPPVTPAGSPGLQVFLKSARAGSVSAGDPVLFRGYRVGSIESAEFDPSEESVRYSVFIDRPYDALVSSNTRFWNASGINVKVGASGVDLQVGSLQTLLVGGVTFDLPDGVIAGAKAKDGENFTLFANLDAVNRKSYTNYVDYVVSFQQSVRGLKPGAPVEYRGITLGSVQRLMIAEMTADTIKGEGDPIPVLIRVEPARLGLPDAPATVDMMKESVVAGLQKGMRATLKTGNLLTGSSVVAIDFYPDQAPTKLGSFAGYPEIPTLEGGIARLEQQLNDLLAKLNALPIEPAVQNLNATLVSLQSTLASVDGLVSSDAAQDIPASIDTALRELNAILDGFSPDSQNAERLNRALTDLNETLSNLESLTRTLSSKPSSIIFSPPVPADPVPQRKQ